MSVPLVPLADVVESRTGTRNPTKTPADSFHYIDIAAIDSDAKRIVAAAELKGVDAPSRARRLVRTADVLVPTIRPNLNAVAIVPPQFDGHVASTGFCVLRATATVLPEYVFYFVRSRAFVDGLVKLVSGAMYPAVSDSQVLAQRLPLPGLTEQGRVVDLLSRAEGIVRLRREAQRKAAELIPAIFIDMFGDPATNPRGWPLVPLGELADVQGGLQVTSARASLPIEAPYLRVANVYRDRLELEEVKSIRLTQAELDRTRLVVGDLLVVEGHGNPSEIGRVATWDGSIEPCTHQNHLIRARPVQDRLLPGYACALLNSAGGRQSLLRAGKTTSGLTTISARNVKEAAVMLPPIERQREFVERAQGVRAIERQQAGAAEVASAAFDALLASAFDKGSDDA